ncbi:MAG: tetratricopeptide repeat-containing sulfotransferase family protein [Pseudomonadales bacterium]
MSLRPTSSKSLIAKANLFIKTNRFTDALDLAQELVSIASNSPQALDTAGAIFSRCGDYKKAQACYEKTIELAPDNSANYYNLAAVKRFLGDDVGAEAAWNKAIALNPKDYDAYQLRSDIRKQTQNHNHIEEVEGLLNEGVSDWRGEMKLCFALAKEYEDIANYEASFAWLKRGADLRRDHMAYRVENDLETIDKIIDVFSEQPLSECTAGYDNAEPIFIVGLPRTGTTLVDRILGSHEQVYSAGELNHFALQMTRLTHDKAGRKLARMELIEQSLKIDFNELGRVYIDSARSIPGKTRYFTDKQPLNFLYCGLIHQALPRAKIIHITRNPMDACYAMYKRLFKDAYPMSYSLEDLGRYYLAYRKLMRHWYKVLPGAIYPVSYEELVNDQEQTSRCLIEHCDLEWQDACLRFEENQAPSTTASATQVRQPIYRSSIGKWRHYVKQLAPLHEFLQRAGLDVETSVY